MPAVLVKEGSWLLGKGAVCHHGSMPLAVFVNPWLGAVVPQLLTIWLPDWQHGLLGQPHYYGCTSIRSGTGRAVVS